MGMISMKKNLAVFFAVVAVFALMTATAFAAGTSTQGQSERTHAVPVDSGAAATLDGAPLEIAPENIVAEFSSDSLGVLQANGLDDETPLPGGSTLTYIDKFGVVVSSSSGNPKNLIGSDSSWQVINKDLNVGAGGDYVYLAYHTSTGFPVPSDHSKPITGLLVVMDVPDPLKDPKDIVWEKKLYHPVVTNWHRSNESASVNLNSGTDDYPKYLYYSNDGWDTGAPILTSATVTENYDARNAERKLDYAYLHKPGDPFERDPWSVYCSPADLRGPTRGGVSPFYLLGTYHKHNAEVNYDDEEHWFTCTTCDYKAITPHTKTVTNVGGYHRTTCSVCKYKHDDPHVDTDGDNTCDVCQCHFAVTADGLYFASFVDAWAYAVSARHDVTISLLETLDANKDSKGESANLTPAWSEGVSITIESAESAPDAKLIVSRDMPFLVANGTLKIDTDVESVYDDSTRIFVTLAGKIILGESGGITLTKATSAGPTVAAGQVNAPILAMRAGSVETEGGRITFSNHVEGAAGISLPQASEKATLAVNNTSITGPDMAIYVEGNVNATISGGYYDGGTGCALKMKSFASGSTTYNPEVSITGGEFAGATCVGIDAGAVLSIKNGIFKGVFTGKNVTECMAEDATAAEIDAAGNVTKSIDRQTLKDAGDSFTFTERTRIGLPLHAITVVSSGNGTAQASKASAVAGEEIALTATPDKGYKFKEWQAEGVSIQDDKFTMLENDVEITAVFEIAGSIPDEPEIVSFTAPADVYVEYGTSVDDILKALPAETTANTAHYEKAAIPVKLAFPDAAAAIGAKYDPAIPFDGGSLDLEIPLTATASGWPADITKVCGADVPVTLHIVSSSLYTAVPVASAGSGDYHEALAVTLDLDSRAQGTEYYYTTGLAKDGVDLPSQASIPYRPGDVIRFPEDSELQYLSAVAYENGVPSGVVTYYYTVTLPHVLTVNGGSGSGTYYLGDAVEVAADAPAAGKRFDRWTIDQGPSGLFDTAKPNATFTMPGEDMEITANYADEGYGITVLVSGGGRASADRESAAAGETVTLTAEPADGWRFVAWQAEGVTIEGDTFVMPAADVEITAVFEADAPIAYEIINGEDSEWTKGSDKGAVFASDAPFDKFVCVTVDDAPVDPSDYRAWSGSTWVELAPAYLEKLGLGEHVLTIASIDGSASTKFTVKQANVTPNNNGSGNGNSSKGGTASTTAKSTKSIAGTGDGSAPVILAAMVLVAAAGLTLAVSRKRLCKLR